MGSKVRVAVVGLGFGRSFLPIYQKHPEVDSVGICDTNPALVTEIGDRLGIEDRFTSLEDLLQSGRFDAVHLMTPPFMHVEQTLAILNAGLHCACAVPMATDLDDMRRIIDARDRAGKVYMLLETAAYGKETLFARDMHARNEFGTLTFLRGAHYQDLEGDYPRYWNSMPPMHYIAHAVAPVLSLTGARATRVSCLGGGRLRPDLQEPGANVFPMQVALFELEGTHAVAEITRSWFQVARSFSESFCVYGERRSFEWPVMPGDDPVIFTLDEERPKTRRDASAQRVKVPYRPDLLPPELAEFAEGWHGGSHPHLVHEFISSVSAGRPSAIDANKAADWTATGVCAHQSSLKHGDMVEIPSFS